MELNEAFERIVGRHWKLIAICVLVGAVLGVTWPAAGDRYTASARVVLDMPDPSSVTEAAIAADTARAIVTGPRLVQAALTLAGSSEDPLVFARDHISVSSLGSSGVLLVSVTTADPREAALLANNLSQSLVDARKQISGEPVALNQITQTLSGLYTQIADLDARIARAFANPASAVPRSRAQITLDQLVRRRSQLAQQEADAQSQRTTLVVAAAMHPQAAVVDRAEVPVARDRSPRLANFALGLLLGLVLGVGAATILATVRPTFVGGRAQARLLGTPLIGEVKAATDDPEELSSVVERIRLAGASAQTSGVVLVPAVGSMNVVPLAARLQAQARQTRGQNHIFSLGENGPRQTGLGNILVAPRCINRADLEHAADLLAVTGSPLLGVVTLDNRRSVRSIVTSTMGRVHRVRTPAKAAS